MRLYLSSYGFGNHIDELRMLVNKTNPRVAVITNAADAWSEEGIIKRYNVEKEIFEKLGFAVERLDLRKYFGKQNDLSEKLKNFDLVWVRGGNVFILRKAMKYSGFDEMITKLIRSDKVAYGGYSAGVCVLSPSLEGIELCDDIDEKAIGYKTDIVWNGLNIIPYSVAPHYKSDHPESERIDKVVEYFKDKKIPYRTLHDGEVILVNKNETILK